MRRRLTKLLPALLILAANHQADAQSCREPSSASSDNGPYSSYTVPNLIAHMIERISSDQWDVVEIHLVNPKIFGLDAENALLTASLNAYLAEGGPRHPQTYSFALRSDDCGQSWFQVFDPVDRRIAPITDVRFIGNRGLLVYEHTVEGNSFGFLYSGNGGRTWIASELEGISGSYRLVDWSVRKPHEGVAIVASDYGIPFDADSTREGAYWVIRSFSGHSWTIDEVIERGPAPESVAAEHLYPSEWDPNSEAWDLRESGDFLSVIRNDAVVLQLSINKVWSSGTEYR